MRGGVPSQMRSRGNARLRPSQILPTLRSSAGATKANTEKAGLVFCWKAEGPGPRNASEAVLVPLPDACYLWTALLSGARGGRAGRA